MDPTRFDELARTMATGVSRRRALARFGAGGLAAGLAAVGSGRVGAALPAGQEATCRLEIVANVRLGPSAGALLRGTVPGELRGDLRFALGPGGAVDRGRLRLEGGTELPVVGQATGRAVNLRVRIAADQALVLVGTAEDGLDRCTGAVDGLLTGPQVGDLGDWHATATALGGGSTAPAAVAVPTRAAGTGASPAPRSEATGTTATGTATTAPTGTADTATATAAPAETATPEPTATATATAEPTPTETLIFCAAPLSLCNGACVDVATDAANCGACGNTCLPAQLCEAGECGPGLLDPGENPVGCAAPFVDCGGACVDQTTDAANCGACGVACAADEVCFAGLCARDHRS